MATAVTRRFTAPWTVEKIPGGFVVKDANGDGVVDAKDLEALGVASDIKTVEFHINGAA